MPLSRTMQQALEERKFDEAMILFRSDRTMVNHCEDGGERFSLFQRAFAYRTSSSACRHFLEFIVTQPDFDLNYRNSLNQTNLQSMIVAADFGLVTLVSDKLRFCYNNGQMSYIFAMNTGIDLNIEIVGLKRANPNNPLIRIKEQEFDRMVQISEFIYQDSLKKARSFPFIRDSMILHAIRRDDVSMFNKLSTAGIDLSKPMEDGRLPCDCITADQPKLTEALRLRRAEQSARSNSAYDHTFFRRSAASALDALAEEERYNRAKQEALTVKHLQQRADVRIEEIDRDIAFVGELAKDVKKEKATSSRCVLM